MCIWNNAFVSSCVLSSTVHFSACLTKEQSLHERPWCSCSRLVFYRGHWACVTGPGTLWHCAWWKRWEVLRNYKQKKAIPCWSWAKVNKVPFATPRWCNTELGYHYTVGVTVMAAGGPNSSNYRHSYLDRSTWQAVSSVVKKEAQKP